MSSRDEVGRICIAVEGPPCLHIMGDTKWLHPLQRSHMGDRPNEAGSRKALSGVLGVRFSGDTGRIPRPFGLRAMGANTLMKAYHV